MVAKAEIGEKIRERTDRVGLALKQQIGAGKEFIGFVTREELNVVWAHSNIKVSHGTAHIE